MSDETRTPENAQPQNGEALDRELNDLKELFQAEFNKATAEANEEAHPVIQELDYSFPADDEDEEPEAADAEEENEDDGDDAAAPQKKKRSRLPLILLITLLVILLIPTATYVALSIRIPTFGAFVSSCTNAMLAKNKEDELDYCRKALESCADGTILEKNRQRLNEKITVLLYETEGYASARAYDKANLTDDMRAAPKTKEYREFAKLHDLLNDVADKAFGVAEEAYRAAEAAAADDPEAETAADLIDDAAYTKMARRLNVPEALESDVIDVLEMLINGFAEEAEATDSAGRSLAVNDYLYAEELLRGMDADTQTLLETVAVRAYTLGCYYEAADIRDNRHPGEKAAKPQSEAYAAMLKDLANDVAALGEISNTLFDVTEPAYLAAGSADKIDYEALADRLNAPKPRRQDVIDALRCIAEGLEAEEKAATFDERSASINKYLEAVNLMYSMDADTQELLEDATVHTFGAGCVYEARLMRDQLFSEEMLAAVKTEAFTKMLVRLEALKSFTADLAPVAHTLAAGEELTDDLVRAALEAQFPTADAEALVQTARCIADGVKLQNEKELTESVTALNRALNMAEALGLNPAGIAADLVESMMRTGDAYDVTTADGASYRAFELRKKYVTDAYLKTADADFQALIRDLDAINAGYTAAETAFLSVANTMTETETPDRQRFLDALNTVQADPANPFTEAFVHYFRYVTESLTDKNEDEMIAQLKAYAVPFEKYPSYYCAELATRLLYRGDTEEAEALIDRLLADDLSDLQGIYLKGLCERVRGALDEAIADAQRAWDRSGNFTFRQETVICTLLQGDIPAAFAAAKALYDDAGSQLTREMCEFVLITAALYKGDDAALRAEMDDYKAQVEELYEEYGLAAGEKTQGIINGALSPADVFQKPPFALYEPNN